MKATTMTTEAQHEAGSPALSSSVSLPKVLLHLEGAALFGAAVTGYALTGGSWVLFAALILVPDVAIAAYLIDKRIGAVAYNATHNMIAPLVLLGVALVIAHPVSVSIALVWLAHVGADRALGYGLKYVEGFRSTHLHRV
jgi:uncharacterized protein DUF4260